MKKIILIVLFLIPILGFSQSRKDFNGNWTFTGWNLFTHPITLVDITLSRDDVINWNYTYTQVTDTVSLTDFVYLKSETYTQAESDILLDNKANISATALTNIPTYADNAAAIAGGLAVGRLYKTSSGVLMIVY